MRALVTCSCAAVLLLSALGPARGGDPVVARTFLEGGKKALTARKLEEAAALFGKARAEDPDLAEAVYWIAVVREKEREDAAALASYREYLALLGQRGNPSPEEQKLRAQAERRVNALGAWDREFRRLEDQYLEELMAFAQDRFEADSGIALTALGRILRIKPGHPLALALRKRITGEEKSGEPASSPFPGVNRWHDLIALPVLSADPGLTYAQGHLILDAREPTSLRAGGALATGASFAYETDFRVTEVYSAEWCTGLSFGGTAGDRCFALVRSSRLSLARGLSGGATEDFASIAVPPLALTSWHRFGVAVRGKRIQIWLDGTLVLEEPFPGSSDLAGDPGLLQAGCRTDRRLLRAGDL